MSDRYEARQGSPDSYVMDTEASDIVLEAMDFCQAQDFAEALNNAFAAGRAAGVEEAAGVADEMEERIEHAEDTGRGISHAGGYGVLVTTMIAAAIRALAGKE